MTTEEHEEHDEEHDDHHDEDPDEHDRKRGTHGPSEHLGQGLCLEPQELFNVIIGNLTGNETNSTNATDITIDDIEFVSLNLLTMKFVGDCFAVDEHTSEDDCDEPPEYLAWILGLVSVGIVTLISVVGIAVLSLNFCCKGQEYWGTGQVLLFNSLVAFGVGALVGDALLHLIPEVFGLHDHDHGDSGHAHEEEEEDDFYIDVLLPSLSITLGFFVFYLVEISLGLFIGHHPHQLTVVMTEGESSDSISEKDKVPEKVKKSFVQKMKEVQPYAWQNLFSDFLHNFIDGIAIGIAYKSSLILGLGTTIAVACHEIAQELGDFAILVQAGLTPPTALLFNFLSGLSSVIGCVIGLAVGSSAEEGNTWILAVTAGGFLYIGLVDMLPQVRHQKWYECVVAGLALAGGVTIMLILAIAEEEINYSDC